MKILVMLLWGLIACSYSVFMTLLCMGEVWSLLWPCYRTEPSVVLWERAARLSVPAVAVQEERSGCLPLLLLSLAAQLEAGRAGWEDGE